MAGFDKTQPYATVENADGSQYFLQGGVLYSTVYPNYPPVSLSQVAQLLPVFYNTTTGGTQAGVGAGSQAISVGGGGAAYLTSKVKSSALVGFTRTNMANTLVMRAGGTPGRILFLGDSILQGFGSGGNGLTASVANGPARKLAAALTALGAPASNDWITSWPSLDTGGTVTTANMTLIDPRITFGGAPTFSTSYNGMSGWPLVLGATGDLVTFRPGGTFDEVTLVYAKNAGLGNVTLSLDGGTTTFATINTNGATDGVGQTITAVPPGSTAVTIKQSGIGYIFQIKTRNTSRPGIDVVSNAVTGNLLQLMATPYATGGQFHFNIDTALPVVCDANARNLVVMDGGFNDFNASRSLAQIQADMTTLIGLCKANANTDVMFLGYAPPDVSVISAANFAALRAAQMTTCAALGIGYGDLSQVLTDYTTDAANGWMYADKTHLSGAGQAFVASLIAQAIMQPLLA